MAGIEVYIGKTVQQIYPARIDTEATEPDMAQDPTVRIIDGPDTNQLHLETWVRLPRQTKCEFVAKTVFESVGGELVPLTKETDS